MLRISLLLHSLHGTPIRGIERRGRLHLLTWFVATSALAIAVSSNTGYCQEDTFEAAPPPSGAVSGLFSRVFAPSASRPKPTKTVRESPSNGGLFVPLKSFSNVFKSRSESVETPVIPSESRPLLPRVPKEPFQNLTRRDRREKSDVDVEVREDNREDSKEPANTATASVTAPPTSQPVSKSFSGSAYTADQSKAPSQEPDTPGAASQDRETESLNSARSFEASPPSRSIDSKGTSRRAAGSTDNARLPSLSKTSPPEMAGSSAPVRNPLPLVDSENVNSANANSAATPANAKSQDNPAPRGIAGNPPKSKDGGLPPITSQPTATNRNSAPQSVQPRSNMTTASGRTQVIGRSNSDTPVVSKNGAASGATANLAPSTGGNTSKLGNSSVLADSSANATDSTVAANTLAANTVAANTDTRSPATASPKISMPTTITNPTNAPQSKTSNVSKPTSGLQQTIPQVRLQVQGANSILVGQGSPYEIVATNEGKEVLQGLLVRASVPKGVQIGDVAVTDGNFEIDSDESDNGVVWELEQLPAGTSKTLRLMINAVQAEHFALGLEWTVTPPSSQMQVHVQQPQLQLALEGPAEVDYGRPQIYRMRIRNPGNADVQKVSVELTAEPYGSNQSEIGDVPAGSERVVEVELTFQQAGRLPIKAKAFSTISNLDASSNIEVNVQQSTLLATWNGPTEFYQGSTAEYDLTIENQSGIVARDITCNIKLPEGVDVIGLPPGITRSGDRLRWEIQSLGAQERLAYPLRLLMNQLGQNEIGFSCESITGEPIQATIKTAVDAVADLHLSVTDPIAPAPVGQPVTYEITITNRGRKTAEDVFVVAQFSEGIEPTRVDGHTGKLIPGQVLFDAIPKIQPNETIVLKVFAEAAKPGTHRFRASVKCQGSEDDLLEEESTRYTAAATVRSDRR